MSAMERIDGRDRLGAQGDIIFDRREVGVDMKLLTMKRPGAPVALVLGVVGLLVLGRARVGYGADTDAELISKTRKTMDLYKQKDPGIDSFFRRSVGYVVFPGIGKGGLVVGGAHGTGILFENGSPTGKVTMNQVSVGAQAGGQEFSQIVFYETPKVLAELKAGKAELGGQLSAVALKSGAAAGTQFKNGVAVFTAAKGGLMYEASVGGQKFDFHAF
jgi:lipid-binding SYLF domain-containing protein